jgi:hypothetical protein
MVISVYFKIFSDGIGRQAGLSIFAGRVTHFRPPDEIAVTKQLDIFATKSC